VYVPSHLNHSLSIKEMMENYKVFWMLTKFISIWGKIVSIHWFIVLILKSNNTDDTSSIEPLAAIHSMCSINVC
jgi:hypothetical protein